MTLQIDFARVLREITTGRPQLMRQSNAPRPLSLRLQIMCVRLVNSVIRHPPEHTGG